MRRLLPVLFLLVSATAHAEWMEASSDHFVVYGDTSERNLRRFAEQMERFDAAMSAVTGTPRSKPSKSARVTIFMVGSDDALRDLYGQNDTAGGLSARYVAGFYSPRIEGPVAFVPDVVAAKGGNLDFSMIILLHEYAHHFNFSNSRFPAPRWINEGSAEFFASAGFGQDGSVTLGRPASHRARELTGIEAADVTVTDLVDPDHYERRTKGKSPGYDAFYGRSWLLFHYLTFEPSRKGQLTAYIRSLAAGKPSREAAETVFGDLAKLDKELDVYMRRSSLLTVKLKPELLSAGEIAVRTLRPGEVAAMPVVMRSKRGVGSQAVADKILADAQAVAARFPADAAVLAALAEAEYDAGNHDAAVAAADRALAIDPSLVNAHIQKGYALFSKARQDGKAESMRAAQDAFLALNRLEIDHPVPLVYFYQSLVAGGGKPTDNAVAALERASALAPYSREISMMLAHRYLDDGEVADARAALLPVAYNPHGGDLAARLRDFLSRLDAASNDDTAAFAAEFAAMFLRGTDAAG
jgi:tetratricopeptide (TPR) repeat protein